MRLRLALIDIVFALRILKSVAYKKMWSARQDLSFPLELVRLRRCFFHACFAHHIRCYQYTHRYSHPKKFPFFIWALQDDSRPLCGHFPESGGGPI